jgi:hypothetical protein
VETPAKMAKKQANKPKKRNRLCIKIVVVIAIKIESSE